MKKIAVTGAGGFIGHHLLRFLKNKGEWVRGIDIKKNDFKICDSDEFIIADLRDNYSRKLFEDIDEVYALASDVGGVGYLSKSTYDIFKNNVDINVNTLEGTLNSEKKKLLFVSSACIYPLNLQEKEKCSPLNETNIYPINPENSYGLEKLTSEFMFLNAVRDNNLDLKIVRPQNVYGHEDLFRGGKEKAIGALCFKAASAKKSGKLEIWGDGKQTRSFCFVEDMVEGFWRLMNSDYSFPLNMSVENAVTIKDVADLLNKISGKNLKYNYNLNGAQGVRGRQSDISKMKEVLKWNPQTTLYEGLKKAYSWVEKELEKEK
jgi:GDP-D-mannose 3', 5'-epimerase